MGATTDYKEFAVTFLKMLSAGHAKKAFELHVGPGFKHHNPHFPGDQDVLAAAMDESAREFPKRTHEILLVISDGDLVAVHSRLKLTPEHDPLSVVHIMRFENGKVAELWDVVQFSVENSPNENGMF